SFPAQCEAGRIFTLGFSGNLYSTTTPTNGDPSSTSTQISTPSGPADFTPTGTANTGVNGLGVAEDASTFYAVQRDVSGTANSTQPVTVFQMNGTSGAVDQTTIPNGVQGTNVMGAVDPKTGIYYFATYANIPSGSTNPRILRIVGFDPN